MKTPLEIIEETVKYYSEDPSRRAVVMVNGAPRCKYLTRDGRMCAVGRCLDQEKSDMDSTNAFGIEGTRHPSFVFKPEYDLSLKYDVDFIDTFWSNLQLLHDGDENWDNEGLTEGGEALVTYIIDLVEQSM